MPKHTFILTWHQESVGLMFAFIKDNKKLIECNNKDFLVDMLKIEHPEILKAKIIHANELLLHLKVENRKSEEWEKAGPDRWASKFTEDLSHWHSYGIYTVEQFVDYLDAEHERNMRKSHMLEYGYDD